MAFTWLEKGQRDDMEYNSFLCAMSDMQGKKLGVLREKFKLYSVGNMSFYSY